MFTQWLRVPRSLALPALAITLTVAAAASARMTQAGPATAAFKVSGPAGMTVEGSTANVAVTDDGTTMGVAVALPTLTTGIGLRDKHMKDDLEVERYPTAELKVARSALHVPAAGASTSGDARGTMKLHGEVKDVTFHYTAKRDGASTSVHGTARIDMGDFGIKTPSYLGITVKRDVDLTIDFVTSGD